jgi:hypothetical protein
VLQVVWHHEQQFNAVSGAVVSPRASSSEPISRILSSIRSSSNSPPCWPLAPTLTPACINRATLTKVTLATPLTLLPLSCLPAHMHCTARRSTLPWHMPSWPGTCALRQLRLGQLSCSTAAMQHCRV